MMQRFLVGTAVFLLVPTLIQTVGSADDYWPGWRGPGRDGKVIGVRPPAEWPERLEQVWQVEVGNGYGSPLVSGGNVYQHARQGEDEVLWCLDLETGAVKWRKSYAAPFKMGGGGEWHGKGPKSSPTMADGRVFTLSISGLLSAWDAETGERLWRRDYGSRFVKSHPYWGVSTSPLVDGNRVVVHFGTDSEGALMALDTESGESVWSQGNDYGKGRFFCLDIQTGEVLWQGPGRTGSNVMLLTVPGYIVALVDNGELQVISASGGGYEKVASYRVSENPTWAPPVLLDGRILVKDSDTLTLLSLPRKSDATGG